MSKQVTVTYSVTYNLAKGKERDEYLEWLDDYKDKKSMRKWWVIDRFIGHDNIQLFDKKAKLRVEESK